MGTLVNSNIYKIKYKFNDAMEVAVVNGIDAKDAIRRLEKNIGEELTFIESIKCVIDIYKKIDRIIIEA